MQPAAQPPLPAARPVATQGVNLTSLPVVPERPTRDTLVYGHEFTRRLALVMLTIIIGIEIAGVGYAVIVGDPKRWDAEREFVEITFIPLIGLLGTAIAFYTGATDAQK